MNVLKDYKKKYLILEDKQVKDNQIAKDQKQLI